MVPGAQDMADFLQVIDLEAEEEIPDTLRVICPEVCAAARPLLCSVDLTCANLSGASCDRNHHWGRVQTVLPEARPSAVPFRGCAPR